MGSEPEEPFCHWCETQHSGERLGQDGKYCPGPLLEPHPSWKREMWIVEALDERLAILKSPIRGHGKDKQGNNWDVQIRLGAKDSPVRWQAEVLFLTPEGEAALGAEFEVSNGVRCIAKVTKRL